MRHWDEERSAFTGDEFFALVDEHLTPAMAALGYHRIGGYLNNQPASRSRLNRTTRGEQEVPFLWFDFGFEAGSDEVMQLVGPEDPDSEDEWWLHYEPPSGRLELNAWRPVADGRVDWDIGHDDGPCSAPEVRRRLRVLAQAVVTFASEHGGTS